MDLISLLNSVLPTWPIWLMQFIAMCLTALILPGLKVTSISGPILTVLILSWINTKYWDAALFLQIPNNFSLQALILICFNAAIFWIIVKILPGIEISGIITPLIAPMIFSLVSILLNQVGPQINWNEIILHIQRFFETARGLIGKVG